jgi:tripeptidyl-peptidase-1
MRFSLLAVCGLLAGAIAAPTAHSRRHVVHERRSRLPANWRRSTKLSSDAVLPLRIALTQSNLDRAEEFLMDVSHPESPNFGKHWTSKQVAETFAPSDETVAAVTQWLLEAGIVSDRVKQSQSLNWLHAEVTVEEAEALLKTKYYRYTHSQTGQAHVACDEYSIPEDIQRHVDFITPTLHFDAKIQAPKKRRALDEREIDIVKRQTSAIGHDVQPGSAHAIGSPGDASLPKKGANIPFSTVLTELENCDVSIVPSCLRALYLIPEDFPAHPNSGPTFILN